MRDSARIQAVIELLGAYKQHVGSRGKPVDAIVASYYRTRRYIGGDRTPPDPRYARIPFVNTEGTNAC